MLITIVVTAMITAFVKEIVVGLLSLLKKFIKNKAITAKLRKAITINKIMFVVNLGLMVYFFWKAAASLSDPSPVTRAYVFDTASSLALAAISLVRIEMIIASATQELKFERLKSDIQAAKAELQGINSAFSKAAEQLAGKSKELLATIERADSKDP
jgi:hypothetical protein